MEKIISIFSEDGVSLEFTEAHKLEIPLRVASSVRRGTIDQEHLEVQNGARSEHSKWAWRCSDLGVLNLRCYNAVMNIYDDLFYRIYSWNTKYWGKIYRPQDTLVAFALTIVLNLFTVDIFVEALIGARIQTTLFVLLLVYLTVWVSCYVYFIKNKRYERIIETYGHESAGQKKVGTIIATVYLVGTFLAMMVAVFFSFYIGKR